MAASNMGEGLESQDGESMAEPVTRHALIPVEGQFLLCGIDTLDLGIYIDWAAKEDGNWAGLMNHFHAAKAKAQEGDGYVDTLDDERSYIVRPGGKQPNYRYHLQFAEYHIFIAVTKDPKYSPNAYVSLNSETLWSRGIQKSIDLVCSDIDKFGGVVKRILISRCDLCADYKLSVGLREEFLKAYSVTRSRKVAYYTGCGSLETYYVGSKGAPVLLRLYDKGKEVAVNNKGWFKPLWGIDDIDKVWRVEFQLRREALKQFGIHSVDDLKDKLYGLWRYLTGDWFSLRAPDDDRQDRRTVHPLWKNIQECATRFGPVITVERHLNKSLPSRMWFASRFASLLVSLGAVYGFTDVERCVDYLFDISGELMAKKETNFQEEVIKRALKMGYDLDSRGGADGHE